MIIDESNIKKSILKVAVPAVIEQALIMIVGVVSMIFVGHIGNQAVSAVGLVNSLFAFIQVFFVALSTGCTVIIARLIGEENNSSAKVAIKQSVFLGFIAALLFSILCIIFARPIIVLFFRGAETLIINMATQYLKITLITLPLMIINIIISGSLRGAGDTKTPMLIANIVNVLNIVLSYILIFGINIDFLGFHYEGMGFVGAAVAITISRGIGGILSCLAVAKKNIILNINYLAPLKIDWSLLKRILRVGIPASAEQLIMQGGFLVLQIVISGMGTEALTVYQIVMNINSICFVPIFGFGIAATTFVGQSLGAKRIDLARKSGWMTLNICLVVTIILTTLLFIFANFIISIYTDDATVIAIGTAAIRLFSASQPFVTVVTILSNALRGAGDIAYVMLTSFVGIWCFRILLTYSLDRIFVIGITAVWIALFMDYFIRSVMYIIRFKRGRWANISI